MYVNRPQEAANPGRPAGIDFAAPRTIYPHVFATLIGSRQLRPTAAVRARATEDRARIDRREQQDQRLALRGSRARRLVALAVRRLPPVVHSRLRAGRRARSGREERDADL